jgi:hypothetical protein
MDKDEEAEGKMEKQKRKVVSEDSPARPSGLLSFPQSLCSISGHYSQVFLFEITFLNSKKQCITTAGKT